MVTLAWAPVLGDPCCVIAYPYQKPERILCYSVPLLRTQQEYCVITYPSCVKHRGAECLWLWEVMVPWPDPHAWQRIEREIVYSRARQLLICLMHTTTPVGKRSLAGCMTPPRAVYSPRQKGGETVDRKKKKKNQTSITFSEKIGTARHLRCNAR